jgi:hypothetical protein
LWWTKWHWDRFFSESFGFPLSVSFHCCSIFTHVSVGWTKGPLEAHFYRDIVSSHRNNKSNSLGHCCDLECCCLVKLQTPKQQEEMFVGAFLYLLLMKSVVQHGLDI